MSEAFKHGDNNPTLIFLFLICLQLAWNAGRSICTCISLRYYYEIIKEVRQISTIRLSDFTDSAAEYDQEFHEEMMNEYPGHGHKENVIWYCTNGSCFVTIIFLDILAASSIYFQSYFLLILWLCLFLALTIFEVSVTICMMNKWTNQKYFKRKWRHCLCTLVGCTIFRLYLIWVSQDLPLAAAKQG